jgi:hypothetical protein
MIGKCERQNAPSTRAVKTKHPLEQVNCDSMMVNEISIEGYRYAMILTDTFSGLIWVYGNKTKEQSWRRSRNGTATLRRYEPSTN